MEHHVAKFKDVVDLTMDEVSSLLGHRTPCAYCGVFRRKCMNLKAREIGADVLATGHNLDDAAQAILMNFTRGDVERLARMGPHEKVQPGLVPRIMPLRQIPEKEVYLYALLRDIDFRFHLPLLGGGHAQRVPGHHRRDRGQVPRDEALHTREL